MPQTDDDKKKITNPFGSGKNYLKPETNEVVGEKIERTVVPKGEIKIPIPQDEIVSTPKEVLPEVQVIDKEGTNYLDPNELAKLESIPNHELDGVTLSSPLTTKLDENIVKKKGINKKVKVGCISFAIVIFIVFVFLSLIAFSVGRDNSLSNIARSIPIESIPIVNLFVKPSELMILDGLMYTDSSSKGNEIALKSDIKGNDGPSSENFNLKIGNEKYIFNYTDNKSGSIEVLIPSLTEQYFKISIKDLDEYKDNPQFQSLGAQSMRSLLQKYNNKYIKMSDEKKVPKVTDPDFFKPENINNGISESQADNLRIDFANIQIDMKPKLTDFLEKELVKINKFVKINNSGRVKVRDYDTYKLNVDFTAKDLENYKTLLKPSLTSLLVDNSENIAKMFCHATTVYTTQTFTVDELETCVKNTSKTLKNSYTDDKASFLNSLGIKNVSVYVDIVSGRIVKYDFTIYDLNISTNFEQAISLEIIPLKDDLKITIPTESEKFKDFIKDLIYSIFSGLY